MTHTQHNEAAAITPDLTALYDLREAYKNSTQGEWKKGATTHHTVTETGYKIAEFHHADDASFCDVAHKHMPALLALVEALTAERDALEVRVGALLCERSDALAKATAERDAAVKLSADRLVDAERLTKWILQRGNSLGDHACARCRPNSEIIKAGFSCAYHLAQDLDAARQAAKDAA